MEFRIYGIAKNRVNILPQRIKQLSSKFSMFTCKKHFRCNFLKVASKVLDKYGGTAQIWTGEWRFCRPLPYRLATVPYEIRNAMRSLSFGAGDEARTRYLHLGKVALYRMSYTRISVPDWEPWCLRSESNQRHEDFQSSALPTELQRHIEQETCSDTQDAL